MGLSDDEVLCLAALVLAASSDLYLVACPLVLALYLYFRFWPRFNAASSVQQYRKETMQGEFPGALLAALASAVYYTSAFGPGYFPVHHLAALVLIEAIFHAFSMRMSLLWCWCIQLGFVVLLRFRGLEVALPSLYFGLRTLLPQLAHGNMTVGENAMVSQLLALLLCSIDLNIMHRFSIIWFVHTYLWNAQTQLLILYWLVLIVAFIAIVTYLLFSEKPKWKLTWIRKLFHLLALLLFLPGIHYQADFLRYCFVIALVLFLLLECVRVLRVPLLGPFLHHWMTQLIDEKDRGGTFILTHIYLLFGCAMPLLLLGNISNKFVLASGTLVLGVGDSAASLVGSSLPSELKHKWHTKTNKSIEGSLAALLAMLVMLQFYGEIWNLRVVMATFAAVVFEGCTVQVDNLVLPLFYLTLLLTCYGNVH